jgi:tRNA 2-thiouridine synthesizing protein A
MSSNHPDSELDATGLLCPLPVLKARKRLEAMASGSVLLVRASDPMAAIDIPHFCHEQGHALIEALNDNGIGIFRIKRR